MWVTWCRLGCYSSDGIVAVLESRQEKHKNNPKWKYSFTVFRKLRRRFSAIHRTQNELTVTGSVFSSVISPRYGTNIWEHARRQPFASTGPTSNGSGKRWTSPSRASAWTVHDQVPQMLKHSRWDAKTWPAYLIANILKTPWPNARIAWKLVNFCNIICWA